MPLPTIPELIDQVAAGNIPRCWSHLDEWAGRFRPWLILLQMECEIREMLEGDDLSLTKRSLLMNSYACCELARARVAMELQIETPADDEETGRLVAEIKERLGLTDV